jgi:hypothetical protein
MPARYGPVATDFVGLAAPDLCNLLDFFPPLVYNTIYRVCSVVCTEPVLAKSLGGGGDVPRLSWRTSRLLSI